MNKTIRFRSAKKESSREPLAPRPVFVTKIPQNNILDLRSVASRDAQRRSAEPIELTEPQISVSPSGRADPGDPRSHQASRSRHGFLTGMLLRAQKNQRSSVPREHEKNVEPTAPPLPKILAQEPAPPPLESTHNLRGWRFRGAVGFALFASLLIAPVLALSELADVQTIQGRVLGASTQGYDALQVAQEAITADKYAEAATAFGSAEKAFAEAQNEFDRAGTILGEALRLIPQVSSGQHLLSAGQALSESGKELSMALQSLSSENLTDVSFGRQIASFGEHFTLAADAVHTAAAELQRVNLQDIPAEYQSRVERIASVIPALDVQLQRFKQSEQLLSFILGMERPQRYLVLFQNNGEIRPTGGFIGSLALLDVDDGVIRNLEVPGGGTYDVAGQLREQVIAPSPLHLVNPHWNIQDANWFPDFPASARKVMWFYERSGGPTVDGIIAMTPAVLESFLELTGPIDMPEFEVTVTDENFIRLAQTYAEKEYDVTENQPKKFIATLLPILLHKAFTLPGDQFLALSTQIQSAFSQKDLLVYLSDTEHAAIAHDLGWDGTLRTTGRDYLYVVHSNIGGGKTDRAIENLLKLTTEITANGRIINTLSITRRHTGDPRDPFEGAANVDYVRVYVPSGSTLVSAEGFDRIPSFRFQTPDAKYSFDEDLAALEGTSIIDEPSGTRITTEFGKTAFGNWISVDAGETGTATISYELPFRFAPRDALAQTATYGLLVQRQPGVADTAFVQNLRSAYPLDFLWKDERYSQEGNSLTLSSDLSTDRFFGFISRK